MCRAPSVKATLVTASTAKNADPKKVTVWRFLEECFNQGREGVALEICHPDYINRSSVMAVPKGPEGLVSNIRAGRSTIEGLKLNVIAMVAEGDDVILLRQTRGKTGRYLGDGGSDEEASQWTLARFGFEDGRIRHHVSNWEPLRIMAQGGALDAMLAKANGRHVADFTAAGLKTRRFENYTKYPAQDEAVAVHPADPETRRRNAALAENVLRHAFGAGATPAAEALAGGDAYLSYADFPDQRGPTGLTARRTAFRAAFGDAKIEIKTLLVEAGSAAMRWELTIVNHGGYLGLPATGRTITVTGSSFARIENGRVVEWMEVMDLLRLVRQLGGLAAVMPGCFPDQ